LPRIITGKINASARIIADISSGIYRTPANALKELVSNAWDADAPEAVINTGYPRFELITCSDTGLGMTTNEFRRCMKHIGGSFKRIDRDTTPSGRPIIGKIGIGILAIAQICDKFSVFSSNGDSTRFEAQIDLSEFREQKAYKTNIGNVRIGQFKCSEYRLAEDEKGKPHTRILLQKIDPGFHQRLLSAQDPKMSVPDFRARRKQPITFDQFLAYVNKKKGLNELSEYDNLLWGLSIATPIQYLDKGPFLYATSGKVDHIKKGLSDFKFRLVVDGMELRKPIVFPTSKDLRDISEDQKVYDNIDFDREVEGRRFKFRGYVFYQRRRIFPSELQGVLIRIRNVAIGSYDRSLLGYPIARGPQMALLSSEIYVDSGLEDALNIDRNSFRETDSHFTTLQKELFLKLNDIFTEIKSISRTRMRRVRRENEQIVLADLQRRIEETTGLRFELEESDEKSQFPLALDLHRNVITIFWKHRIFPRNRAQRELLQRILAYFEIANLEATKESARERFYALLRSGITRAR